MLSYLILGHFTSHSHFPLVFLKTSIFPIVNIVWRIEAECHGQCASLDALIMLGYLCLINERIDVLVNCTSFYLMISETSEAYLGKVMIVSDFMETVVRIGGVT